MLNQSNSENDRSNYRRANVIEILLNTRCRPTFSHSTRETDPPPPTPTHGTAPTPQNDLKYGGYVGANAQSSFLSPLPPPPHPPHVNAVNTAQNTSLWVKQ